MLIDTLLNVIVAFLRIVLIPFSVATLPADVASTVTLALGYLSDGVAIVAGYTHFSYLVALFALSATVETFFFGYHIIMWILRKIPFIGID